MSLLKFAVCLVALSGCALASRRWLSACSKHQCSDLLGLLGVLDPGHLEAPLSGCDFPQTVVECVFEESVLGFYQLVVGLIGELLASHL